MAQSGTEVSGALFHSVVFLSSVIFLLRTMIFYKYHIVAFWPKMQGGLMEDGVPAQVAQQPKRDFLRQILEKELAYSRNRPKSCYILSETH